MNLNFCLPKFWVIALFLINSWFLSGAYLKTYTSYGYEIMWVNRSHQGGVQCTWTLTPGCFIFELLPFVYFHTWILSGAYLQDYTSYGYEISWMVITWGKTGVFWDNLPLLLKNCLKRRKSCLLPQCFLLYHYTRSFITLATLDLSCAIVSNLDQSNILSFGEEIKEHIMMQHINHCLDTLIMKVIVIDDENIGQCCEKCSLRPKKSFFKKEILSSINSLWLFCEKRAE